MAKIGDLVTKLQIGEKTFKNPEWWSTQHKLKREVKQEELFKPKINTATYSVNSFKNLSADTFVKELKSNLDFPRYKEFAPWSSMFNKYKNIIIFK